MGSVWIDMVPSESALSGATNPILSLLSSQPRVRCRTCSGEILVDVESASASLHFEWALPWDSSLVKAGECSESWRGQVHFSGQTLAVARTEETFGFDLYDESEGLFMTPANGETVPVDTEYDLTWDPTLLKYFVSGEGAALGSEDVSAQVQLYAVSSDSSVYNLTAEPVNNTGSFSTIFPSSHDTDTAWYMLIFSAENSAVWSWSPGWFTLSSGSQRKLQLQDSTLNQEAEDIQDQPHHSSFPASKWPSSLSYFAEYGHAPSKRQDRYVVHSVQENRRRLDSTACMAFFNGQDAQNSLDKVTLGGYAFYENDAAADSIITPLTLGEESCSPVPAPTPDRTLSPTPSPTTPPPTNLPTPAPVRPRPTEAPLTPAPTRLRPTPAPLAAGDTPSPTTAVDLPPEWQNCDLDGNPSSYLNDKWCDPVLNNADCGYDGGDCCTASCASSAFNNCPENDDQCVDPALAPTPAPTLASPWPDCALAGNPATWLADSYCDVDLNNVDCGYDGGDCCTATCAPSESCFWGDSQCVDPAHAPTPAPSPAPTPAPTVPAAWQACDFVGLPTSWLSDAYCDVDLNNEDCGYDGGDCCSATCANGCSESDENCVDPDHAPWPDCDFGDAGSFSPLDVGDSVCNTNLNNEGCAYDGGDCCTSTCIDSPGQDCTQTDYFCVDPGHLATPAPTALDLSTPAPTISSEWPDCVLGGSLASAVGDGLCDASLNNEPCGYDGGDCCAATCLHRGVDQCTDGNAFCLDERYRYDCDFGTVLSETDLGDGYCDEELYTLPCDFDDGDCCIATCVSGPVHDCPESKDDYPHCDEEQSGEGDDSEERDDDFSRAFTQGPGSIMRLASLLSVGLGVARNLRPQ